jgi:hypothetical protein
MTSHPLENWDGTLRKASSDDVLQAMWRVNVAETEWEAVKARLSYYSGHPAYDELGNARRDFGTILDTYIDQRIAAHAAGE